MAKKFYLAASFKNSPLVNLIATRLRENGWQQTYDWTKNQRAATFADLNKIGQEEYQGVVESDFFVFLFPAGKGANIEFGIATALKKPIYIFDCTNEIEDFAETSTFYFLDNVLRFSGDVQEFVELILENEG